MQYVHHTKFVEIFYISRQLNKFSLNGNSIIEMGHNVLALLCEHVAIDKKINYCFIELTNKNSNIHHTIKAIL